MSNLKFMVDFTIDQSLANFSPVANFIGNFKADFTENFIAVLHVTVIGDLTQDSIIVKK